MKVVLQLQSTMWALTTCCLILAGIVLDPTYSGKAMHGLINDMKGQPQVWAKRRVLFLHTGGLLSMYDKTAQLQPIVEGLGRASRMAVA